jgi:hypothetical protein
MFELSSRVSVVMTTVTHHVRDYGVHRKVVSGFNDLVATIQMVALQLPSFKVNVDSRNAATMWGAVKLSVKRGTGLIYFPHSGNNCHALRLRVLRHLKIQCWSILGLISLQKNYKNHLF